MKSSITFLIILIFGSLLTACNIATITTPQISPEPKPHIIVSILPQKFFVEQIGGNLVTVNAMIGPGYSPATYEPTPQDIQKLNTAQIYFRIGHIGFEQTQMDNLAQINPNMTIIDTSEGINLRNLEAHSHDEEEGKEGHHHEKEEENEHHETEDEDEAQNQAGTDPHIWLSPILVKHQAEIITNALIDLDPQHAQQYTNNKNNFIDQLNTLDNQLQHILAPFKDKTILVYHPAFGYLADQYGFHQQHIEIEGKTPTIEQMQTIIQTAKQQQIKAIFVQQQFDTKSAETIASEIGGTVIPLDPLAEDYLNNMQTIATTITQTTQL
jgi:zinc transport system substrate-binding protein